MKEDFGWEMSSTQLFRSNTTVARTEGYARAPKVWA
jgi:hypothetical protein